jgi:quercetin dioxygenase-like cupin family protein
MSDTPRYVIRPSEMHGYSPANHSGTWNRRLIGPRINGAKHLEIALGEIEPGEGAPVHAHPALEQATYVLEGEAIAEIDGVEYHVQAGDLLYFPEKVFHSIRVIKTVKLLVIYAPPYDEHPAKVMKRDASTSDLAQSA